MAKKTILVLAETIDVDSSSAGKANMGFIQSLLESDFQVEVFHYSHKKVLIPHCKTTLINENKLDPFYVLSRAQRVLQRITKRNFSKSLENKFGFSFSFSNDASSMATALKRYKQPFDLIITLSKAASFRTHAALLKIPEFHLKWLAYVHDPYPFHCYPPPYNWTEAGHQQKEAFFKEVSEKARYSGFPSLLLQEWMGDFFPQFLKTGVVLPHQNLRSIAINNVTIDYIQKENFVLLHAGSLLDHRNPFPLIAGYKKFLNKFPKAKTQLVLVGSASPHEPQLTNRCAAIPSIYKSDGYVAYAVVQQLQNMASVSIILEAVSHISPFLPGKFPHQVSVNKPILHLGPKKSETRRLLGADYVYSCEADDIDAIADCIEKMYLQWKSDKHNFLLNRPDLEAHNAPVFMASQLRNKVLS